MTINITVKFGDSRSSGFIDTGDTNLSTFFTILRINGNNSFQRDDLKIRDAQQLMVVNITVKFGESRSSGFRDTGGTNLSTFFYYFTHKRQ